MKATVKSTLTKYRFDLSDAVQADQYAALRKRLKMDRKCFNVLADCRGDGKPAPEGPIVIETDHLFSNQFNTKCGHRVFAWYEGIYPNRDIRKGHYIDLTDEIKQLLGYVVTCGYCGKQQPPSDAVFCGACLDSEYLKEKDLHLLRLLPVGLHMPKRDALTEAEAADLIPRYVKRQTTGDDSRAVQKTRKQRADIERKCATGLAVTQEERNGLIWLLDGGWSVDNVIYYSHTRTFSWGWRQRLSWSLVQVVLGFVSEFPFPYEIKGIDSEGNERTWQRE